MASSFELLSSKRIYFASDLHLGAPNTESSIEREKRFVSWLDSIAKDAQALYLVGDVYNDAFILARNLGYDVFNTLDVGQVRSTLEKFKFLEGTGHVYYYLFNWLPSSQIGSADIQLKLP